MKKNTRPQSSNNNKSGQVIGFLVLIGLLFAFVLGLAVSYRSPEQAALTLEKQKAVLPYEIASKITGYVVFGVIAKVAVFVMGGYFTFYILAIFRNWLDTRARLIHQKDGIFPLVRADDGHVYDPNRAAGDNPYITLAALKVQETAALPRADRTIIKAVQKPLQLPQPENMPALPQPVLNWPSRVPLRGLLNETPSINRLVLGVTLDETGNSQIVEGSMSDLVHVAVGGSSGWGKSVFLQAIAYQIAMAKEKPDMCLIDLEGTTLNVFAKSDRLLYPLADSEQSAIAVLQALNSEMEHRKQLFNEYPGIDRLDRYNDVSGEPLKPIITVIDEATALLDNKEVEAYLKELTLRARKYGLWLILAGQDWKASSLDTAIRNQLSTRVQFKALNGAQSRVLLGESDAKDLTSIGRAYAVLPGRQITEIQAPYISGSQILESVSGNGARFETPKIIDAQVIEDDTNLSESDRIIMLKKQGLSLNEIQKRVFGGVGGNYYYRVKEVLANNE